MPFTPKNWVTETNPIAPPSNPATATPISGESLEDLETRVTGYSDDRVPHYLLNADGGAAGTGVANDTSAINTLISTADTAVSGDLRAIVQADPAKSYLTDGILAKSNVILDNRAAVILKRTNGASVNTNSLVRAVETLSGSTYYGTYSKIRMQGGFYDPNGFTTPAHIIRLMYVEDIEIDDVTVQHDAANALWAFCLGGRKGYIHNCKVLGGTAVFQDGIHLQHGTDWRISDNYIESGDDAIALFGHPSTETYLAADPEAIRRVSIVNNVVKAEKGHALRIGSEAAADAAENEVTQITIDNLVGQAGISRNGGIYIESDLGSSGLKQVRDVQIRNFDLTVGGSSHDGTNAYGLRIVGADRIAAQGKLRCVDSASSDFRGVQVDNCTRIKLEVDQGEQADANAFDIRSSDDVRLINCHAEHADNETTSTAPVNIESVTNLRILDSSFLNVRNGVACITSSGGTGSTVFIRGCRFSHDPTGLSSGYAVNIDPTHVDWVEIVDCDFEEVYSAVNPDLWNSGKLKARGNRNLTDTVDWELLWTARERQDAVASGSTPKGMNESAGGVAGGSLGSLGAVKIDPTKLAGYGEGGTARLKIEAYGFTNATAPATNLFVRLYKVDALAGGAASVTTTYTYVASSEIDLGSPAASAEFSGSVELDCPTADTYTLAFYLTGNMAASSAATIRADVYGRVEEH